MKTNFISHFIFSGAHRAIPHHVVPLKNKEFTTRKNRGEELNLKCLSGMVWITQPGDPEDHILQANESLKITKKGMTVVQALPEAVVCW
jgi:hypothetical protein